MQLEFAYFHFVLIHLELKQEIRSYSLVSPSKTIPDTRPKLAKCIPVFRPKRPQNHTLWGGAYLYVLYKGEHPPPPPGKKFMEWIKATSFGPLRLVWKRQTASTEKTCLEDKIVMPQCLPSHSKVLTAMLLYINVS